METITYQRIENINDGVEQFKATPGAILLDVRRKDEYAEGHIPNSINHALEDVASISKTIPDKNAKVFVYCRSGVRSKKAQEAMLEMGYTNLTEIGGILDYNGEKVK